MYNIHTLYIVYFAVIVANSSYTGHKIKTKLAKKLETSQVCAKKSYKENIDESSNSSHPSKIQKQACDSTVNDLDFQGDKRKLFSCDFEGCNKKYTKLSHLKVRIYVSLYQTTDGSYFILKVLKIFKCYQAFR